MEESELERGYADFIGRLTRDASWFRYCADFKEKEKISHRY